MTAFLPLAMSSQDSPLCQEKNTDEEEVAAMCLTARSQVSQLWQMLEIFEFMWWLYSG
uniref:Uncharacterized protein n=1 Tax=Spermophilus dauricus TaxID=99837 RepID=A0A8C9Q463_SPEDA